MRNPLYKRLKREFKSDIGKYIVIFLFVTIMVGLCSGYIVGNESMIKSFYETQETLKVEDGHFESMTELNDSIIEAAQDGYKLTIFNLYYKTIDHEGHNIRTYAKEDRKGIINDYEVMLGAEPNALDEIALDRTYCDANGIKVGDTYETNEGTFKVVGIVALSDYSALFEDNADAMMNVKSFSIAIVTKAAFDNMATDSKYNYAYKFNSKLSEDELDKKNEKLMTYLYLITNKSLTSFIPYKDNQAIQFAIEDVENDLVFLEIFFYLIMVGLAFVFAITTKNKIEQEAKTIGTLKAMGYTRWNLIGHYLLLPSLVTVAGAIAGNIWGYTSFKDFTTSLYYRSYSFGTFHTFFSPKAFIMTTIIPLIIVLLISFIILVVNLHAPTKVFLQGKTKKKKKATLRPLPAKLGMINKMQFRVIAANKGTYIAMFIGLLFANLILVFGLCLNPMLDSFKKEILNSQVAPYEYVLKDNYSVDNPNAEKIKVTSLYVGIDTVQVIGVEKFGSESKYLKDIDLKPGEVVISKDLYQKYDIKQGGTFEAKEEYSDKVYTLKVSQLKDQAGAFYVYMDMATFKEYFKGAQTLNGYLSSEELTEIPQDSIYTVITIKDLQAASDQMSLSMGDVFTLFDAFAIILFVLIIYLLAKIVVEKSATAIAMMKILGFNPIEITRAYNLSTGIVVAISELIAIPVSSLLLSVLWKAIMKVRMKGWITFYLAPWIYFAMFGIAMAAFLVVFLIEYLKMRKIPLSLALKRE